MSADLGPRDGVYTLPDGTKVTLNLDKRDEESRKPEGAFTWPDGTRVVIDKDGKGTVIKP